MQELNKILDEILDDLNCLIKLVKDYKEVNNSKFDYLVTRLQKEVYQAQVSNNANYIILNENNFFDGDDEVIRNKDSCKEIMRYLKGLKECVIKKQANLSEDFWKYISNNIVKVSKSYFNNKHYSTAVLKAFILIDNVVKEINKRNNGKELSGTDLMNVTFSLKNPVISFALLYPKISDESKKNIQLGYMQLFAGSMLGIRNPLSHENEDVSNGISINKEEAINLLNFASFLITEIEKWKECEKDVEVKEVDRAVLS